ncbi:hypothetical protein DFQ27_003599 [Actinomortierella ambigua]|uniref:Uncharacterized protein n=1 Tax=Actinomortierella ambigua TaxID=1343610 RepID=A0A9P6Q8M2_9FUNG|nr:hypothetical protein DFQ27_003599 [Actinomortierella ambigua]
MESTVKAAATVQNNILLVQYSPTGKNVGDLYAFVLSETTKPLPFQIQRQTDMQGSKRPVASMSLITVTTSAFTDSKSPTGGVETDDTVPQLLTQSPTDQNASKSVARQAALCHHQTHPPRHHSRPEAGLALALGLGNPEIRLLLFGLQLHYRSPSTSMQRVSALVTYILAV